MYLVRSTSNRSTFFGPKYYKNILVHRLPFTPQCFTKNVSCILRRGLLPGLFTVSTSSNSVCVRSLRWYCGTRDHS